MIIGDFLKALGQITDPRFRRVLLAGIGLSLALLFAIYVILSVLIGAFVPDTFSLPLIGEVTWVDNVLSWGSVFLMIGLSVFLMVPVASAFTSLFLDRVASAVEDRHYPGLPVPREVPLAEAIKDTFTFLGIIIVANLAALLLYLVFSVFGPFIFWALNGFLLGREYFQLVASRFMDRSEARELYRAHVAQIWLAGGLMAIPLSIPLVNLLVPILGAATFTHLFHRLTKR